MDYLELAREAHEGAQAAKRDGLAEEYYLCALTCAFIEIAEQFRKLNETLDNPPSAYSGAEPMETGYVPQL